jgi:PIN like domain
LTSELPDDFIFFIDRSLGKNAVASRLRAVGVSVQIHDDHFPPDAQDSTWLTSVGQRGWLVLTKHKRIQHRVIEQAAVAAASVRLFALSGGNLTGDEMGAVFARAHRRIISIAQANRPPFIARVYKDGSVVVVMNRRKLLREHR